MRRTALRRRLERAIENAEQDDPDGALSTYAWMWRALVRSSESRVGLYFRFARLVFVDSLFLLVWTALRPVRTLTRSKLGKLSLLGSAALVTSLFFLGSEPKSYPARPWSGPLTIQIGNGGALGFEGQLLTDEQAVELIEYYGVKKANVEIDDDVLVERVFEINELLAEAGVEWLNARQIGPAA